MKSSYAPFTYRWAGMLVFLAMFFVPGGAQAQADPPTVTSEVGALKVTWDAAKNAASYKVQWRSGTTETFNDAATDNRQATVTDATEYTIPNLKAGTAYGVRVITLDANGNETPSTENTGNIPTPGQVKNVRVTAGVSGTSTSLVVTWDPVEGVRETGDRYRVEWGTGLSALRSHSDIDSDGTRLSIPDLDAATEYTVKVFALNAGGDGAASDGIKSRPKPAQVTPAPTVAVHDDPGKLIVTWTALAANAATGYKVQWRSGTQQFGTDPGRENLVMGGTMATYDITGLEGIPHTVRVIAMNGSGDGPPSAASTATTPRPGKVSTPRVTAHTDPQKLAVSWDPVPGAGYRVRWKKVSDENYGTTPISTTTATSTTIPASGAGDDLDGVPYMVQVAAVNGTEDPADSEYSSPGTGTPKPGQVPSAELTVTPGTVEELRVSWSEVTGATDGYTVQWRLENGQYSSSDEYTTSDLMYVIPGLEEGSYFVRVWASNASGDGLPTESTSATVVDGADENQVTGVRVTAGVKELTVMWNPVAGATEYTVSVTPENETAETHTSTRTRTVIRELTAGTQYSVTVTADVPDATGEPASEPAVMARPKPGKVSNVKVTVPDDAQQLEVAWGSAEDATGYIVQWKSGTEDYSDSRQVTLTTGDEYLDRKAIIGDGDGTDTDAERDGALEGDLHTVRVIARAGTDPNFVNGDPSSEQTGTPKPGTPAPTVTAHADPGKLTVMWPKVEGATRYKVQWKSGAVEDYAETRQATPTALEYTISGLSAANEYTVQVIARNASGEGDPSDDSSVDTDDVKGRPRPGRVPTVNVQPAAAAGQLDVSWTEVEGATGYKVQWKSGMDDYSDMRQVSVGEAETTLGDGTEGPHADTPLDGIPHTVQVIAFNQSTEDTPKNQDGPPSASRTGTPKPAVVMGQPTLAVHADPGKLTAEWTKVEGATSYKVEWKESDGSYSSNRQASVTALEYTISGLSAANEYVVQVTAMNTSGSSAAASSESAALRPRPAQVTNLTVTAPDEGTGQRLVLSWDAVEGPTGITYIVECKLASDASFTVISRSDATATTETPTGLVAGEQYIFQVKASHSSPAVEGPYSAQQTGRPRPALLLGLQASTSGPKQITVSWTAPTNEVDNYRVEWKKATGEEYHTSRQRQIPGTSNSYVIQGLELSTDTNGDPENTTYTVRVRAIVNSILGPAAGAETGGTAGVPDDGQVTGVRVTPGLGQLMVQWDRLDEAQGYKVQWRSGSQTFADLGTGADKREYEASRSSRSYTIPKLTGGTLYTVQVVAVLPDGNNDGSPDDGPVSPTATGTPIAQTPGQVVDVEVEPSISALVVTWKKTDGVTGYKVEWTSGSERREHDVTTNNEDSPSFSITPTGAGHPDLTPGTRYTVRVRAVNEHATTPGGRWSTGVTSMLLPAGVTLKDQVGDTAGDQFVIPGANSLTVAWNEAAGAHSYKVQWKTENLDYHSSRQMVLTNPMKLEYEIPNLEAGTEYTVRVIATNALGKDGDPSAATDNTGRPEPKKVTGVRVTAGLSQQQAHELTVSWNRVPGADSYKVQWKNPNLATTADRDYDETDGDKSDFGVTGTSYTIPGTNTLLTANTEYTVQVIATAGSGADAVDGDPSDDPEVSNDDVTGLTFPGQVTLAASGVTPGANQLAVEWTAPADGADSYRVQWKTGAQSYHTSPEIPGTETRYVIQGLQAEREYRVQVYASNASGNGQPSAEQTGVPSEPEEGQVTNLRVTEGRGAAHGIVDSCYRGHRLQGALEVGIAILRLFRNRDAPPQGGGVRFGEELPD